MTMNRQSLLIRIPVFYSFHYAKDVMRVQQIRNIGALDDNKPVSSNEWEQVKRSGERSIQRWIDDNMKYKRCVIVLVGEDTSERPWVKYEIEKAWNDGKAIVGIYIHNLRCPRFGLGVRGKNPFDSFTLDNGQILSSVVTCFDPSPHNTYNDIANNITSLVNFAIQQRA
jgi:hypothetical protein